MARFEFSAGGSWTWPVDVAYAIFEGWGEGFRGTRDNDDVGVQGFDATGTWTCPAGVYEIEVQAWGEGANGENGGLAGGANGQVIKIRFAQDGTGSRTLTQPSGISWAGGTEPTLTTTASKADWISLIKTGTSTYDGSLMSSNH